MKIGYEEESEAKQQGSAKHVLITLLVVGMVITGVWGGWEWKRQRTWVEQMEACNRLMDLCGADCPASRQIMEGTLSGNDGRMYEIGCVAGCNKAGIFCSGVFGLTPAPPGWAVQ